MDSAGEIDVGPIPKNNIYIGTLYVLFVFMTTFFVLNTFITILICQFQWQTYVRYGLDALKKVDPDSLNWITM